MIFQNQSVTRNYTRKKTGFNPAGPGARPGPNRQLKHQVELFRNIFDFGRTLLNINQFGTLQGLYNRILELKGILGNDISDNALQAAYKAALPDDLSTILNAGSYQSFSELHVKCSTTVMSNNKWSQSFSVNAIRNRGRGSYSRGNFSQSSRGNFSRGRGFGNPSFQQRPGNCRSCGQYGHWARDSACPNNRGRRANSFRPNFGSANGGRGRGVRQVSHEQFGGYQFQPSDNQQYGDSQNQPISVQVGSGGTSNKCTTRVELLDNTSQKFDLFSCLCDTGSEATLIQSEFVDKNEIIYETRDKLYSVQGDILSISGYFFRKMRLSNGQIVKAKIFITDEDIGAPILLGFDVLKKNSGPKI